MKKDKQADRCAAVNLAHEKLGVAFKSKNQSPRAYRVWEEAVAEFHKVVEEAYPPGFWMAIEDARHGNPSGIEVLVKFLEEDPNFFRSGYSKSSVLRAIKKLDLLEYSARLREVILGKVENGASQEFKEYRKLALKLDSPEFREKLMEMLKSPVPSVTWRAKSILAAIVISARKD